MYKDKRIFLSRMSFSKDFIGCTRGDPYPILRNEGQFTESICDGKYTLAGKSESAFCERLLCRHFPYATYRLKLLSLDRECGFTLMRSDGISASVLFFLSRGEVCARCGDDILKSEIPLSEAKELLLTCRRDKFDIYVGTAHSCVYAGTFTVPAFADSAKRSVFIGTSVCLHSSGAVVSCADSFIDCGVSQADIRAVRYENGEVMLDGGKVYFTVSVRMQAECYQGIFSWVPGTCELEMTGALFFDAGDGIYGNDVASSLLYHREGKKWLLWVCSFSRGHVLAYASFEGDVRFGVNAVDVTLMERMKDGDPDTAFLGKAGDEDPDFIYDAERKIWRMAVCRLVRNGNSGKNEYRYFYFESENPFTGYRHIAHSANGAETGGSLLRHGGKYYLVCGNRFDRRAEYRYYSLPDMSAPSVLRCDYDDGGFRGWGTVISVRLGSRTKYYHLTFDRHNASSYNWSYGNLYCFEAEQFDKLN